MDFIELIILLIIFLAPAIGRLFEKKSPAPPQTEPQPSYEDDPFAEALRQIREALGEPTPEPEPAPPPKPAAAPVPPRPRLEETRLEETRLEETRLEETRLEETRLEPDFHGLGSLERDEQSLERRRPIPVENLERPPVVATEPVLIAPPKRAPLPPRISEPVPAKPVPAKPAPAKPAPAFSSRDFVHRLRDPQRAREAFILHEVFGPPRSRRR